MTRNQAITKAETNATRTGQPYLVTRRTAHPAYPGRTVFLVIAKAEKSQWAADEMLEAEIA